MNGKIVLGYIIFSYTLIFLVLLWMMIYKKEQVNLTGAYKKDKGVLIMFTLLFAIAPLSFPLIIIMYIKEWVEEIRDK